MLFVLIYFIYALVVWRHREGDDEDGPPIHGNTRISVTWIAGTAVIVLGLFVFGTVELIVPAGAGAGQGSAPIWKPSGADPLQVQVIGQQWTSPTATRSSAASRRHSWCCPRTGTSSSTSRLST